MSYADLITNNGTQTLQLPREYRFDTDHVSIEPMGGGLLIKPVKEKKLPTWEELFAMIDEARKEEGDLDLDDLDDPPPQERNLF
jgi:virulence-associated protein VagC